jgi:hypothetical protein
MVRPRLERGGWDGPEVRIVSQLPASSWLLSQGEETTMETTTRAERLGAKYAPRDVAHRARVPTLAVRRSPGRNPGDQAGFPAPDALMQFLQALQNYAHSAGPNRSPREAGAAASAARAHSFRVSIGGGHGHPVRGDERRVCGRSLSFELGRQLYAAVPSLDAIA